MTSTPGDLRATSDALLRDLEALIALEERKRNVPMDDPAIADLARQIQAIAERVLEKSRQQEELTAQVVVDPAAELGAEGSVTINETPRSVASILAEWRDLERRAAAAEPGSAERAEIEILTGRLRDEYRRAVAAARDSA